MKKQATKSTRRTSEKNKRTTRRKLSAGQKATLKTMAGGAALGSLLGPGGATSGAIAAGVTSGIVAASMLSKTKKSGVGGTENKKAIRKFRAKTPSKAYTAAKKKMSKRRK